MDHTLQHRPTTQQQLSTDDVLMGEILISLKRNGVQPPPPAILSSSSSASYRSKVDLTVQMPPPRAASDDTSVSMAIALAMTSPSPSPSPSPFGVVVSSSSSSASPVASAIVAPPSHSPSERTKRYGPVVQLDDLRRCFNMPIAAVARKFGICATLLKKICRRHGIQRWPHRQIRSLQKSIDMLRESLAVAKGSNKDYIAKKIAAFEYTLECIMLDPNMAAKGISAGRLASPASEELARRSANKGGDAAAKSPHKTMKNKKLLASSSVLAAALSEAEEEEMEEEEEMDAEMDGDRPQASPFSSPMRVWSPSVAPQPQEQQHVEERNASMSLKSILC